MEVSWSVENKIWFHYFDVDHPYLLRPLSSDEEAEVKSYAILIFVINALTKEPNTMEAVSTCQPKITQNR